VASRHGPAQGQAGIGRTARSVLAPMGKAPHSGTPGDDRGVEGERTAFLPKDTALTNRLEALEWPVGGYGLACPKAPVVSSA